MFSVYLQLLRFHYLSADTTSAINKTTRTTKVAVKPGVKGSRPPVSKPVQKAATARPTRLSDSKPAPSNNVTGQAAGNGQNNSYDEKDHVQSSTEK